MKKSLLILLFTCWALFFAAFRPVMPFAAETAAFPDGTPVTGGRILMGTIGEPSNLIPYMASDSASGEITGLLYVAPLKYDKDLNVVPWAAASYEVLEGGRLLRFVLRDDIRWEDGVPLTADDVEFTYKLMIDPKTPTAYSGDFLAIESFKKTGRLSFEVRYAKPFARSLMTWMGAILPKHVLEGQDIMTTPVARKPIGAGPYRLAKWDAGSMLTLTASDTYFEGRPNLDEVVYRIIPDPSTMFLELKAGKLDMMSLSPQQYLRQTQGPQWERDWRKYRYLSFSYTFLGFNLEHPFFKDVRVRRAISMAIDRQSLIDGVLLGQGVPLHTHPAWLVGPAHDNPYNRRTNEILAEFQAIGVARSDGNVIHPAGNALLWLRDYFEQDVRSVSPYEEDPRDMRAVCVDPDGSVAGGNLYDAGMLDILDAYVPPGEPSA